MVFLQKNETNINYFRSKCMNVNHVNLSAGNGENPVNEQGTFG